MTKTAKKVAKEKRLAKLIGGTIPSEVLTYMRKNPRQVFSNFQNRKSIFGSYSKELTPQTLSRVSKNLKTIKTGWRTLYTNEQLKDFASTVA